MLKLTFISITDFMPWCGLFLQAKFGWHFENLHYTPDCLDVADAERIRNDGMIRRLLDEELDTLKVRHMRFLQLAQGHFQFCEF